MDARDLARVTRRRNVNNEGALGARVSMYGRVCFHETTLCFWGRGGGGTRFPQLRSAARIRIARDYPPRSWCPTRLAARGNRRAHRASSLLLFPSSRSFARREQPSKRSPGDCRVAIRETRQNTAVAEKRHTALARARKIPRDGVNPPRD